MIELIEICISMLINIMFITLLERKLMSKMQGRLGPKIISKYGLYQPIIDGLKLYIKEILLPMFVWQSIYKNTSKIYIFIYLLISMIIPISLRNELTGIIEIDNVILLLIISSISGYSVLISGKTSNNSYSILGGIRCISQLISNEVYICILMIILMYNNNTIKMNEIIINQIESSGIFSNIIIFILFIIFIISETNRSPFDISEGESELVSGWNIEYSSIYFASFMIGEYGIIIILSYLSSLLWFYNHLWFLFIFIILSFILFRSTLCRLRQDTLLIISWKYILIYILYYLIFIII